MSNIWLIVAREFNERVRKKSFIVTTLLMPVLMLGLMLAPALMMRYASGQTKTIVVIDRSGLVAQHLESSDEVRFETSDLPVDTARRVMIDKFGVLCIGADILANPSDVKLYANSASSMMLERESAGPDRESARTREAARLPDRRSRPDSGRRQDRRQDAGRPQR
ncbi:MAG: ABC transporter permease [Alistipes communis]